MAGETRPERIDVPGPGRESVWDYPRPPRVEPCIRRARVVHAGEVVADSTRALRVLETAGPPTIYIPVADVKAEHLSQTGRATFCEWKGTATHFDLVVGAGIAREPAWAYLDPNPAYEQLGDHVAFYASRVDECYLDDERVIPQPGGY